MRRQSREFTLRQLDTFVRAARAGSFIQAADQLGISQPAVSAHIAALERHLGHLLFVRRRGTTPLLTRAGVELLQKAADLLDRSQSIQGEVDENAGRKVRVRLCIGPRLRDVYLKPILPRLYGSHPEIALELVPVIALHEVQAAFDKGRIDLLVYTIGRPLDGWPNGRSICDVPTVMIGPPGTRAALQSGKRSIHDLSFILPSTEKLSEHWIERQLQALGYDLRRAILYVDFPDVIQQMVEDGLGVSILMHEQVAASIALGKLEVFGPKLPAMRRVIARSASAPAEARIIEDYLIEAFRGPGSPAEPAGAGPLSRQRSPTGSQS